MRICVKALIVGMGRSGRAVAAACQQCEIPFLAFDDKKIEDRVLHYPVFDAVQFSSSLKKEDLLPGTKCIVSPGVPQGHPLIRFCRENGVEIISEIEFAYRMVQEDPPMMIAVTGTNGKTTVVLLLEHLLRKKGIDAQAVGNIGRPLAEVFLQLQKSIFIVEISSFQLMTTNSKMFTHAACLEISPNHLDWHSSMEEYIEAKIHLGDLVKPGGIFLCHKSLCQNGKLVEAEAIEKAFFQAFPEAALHDSENFLAAFQLAKKFGVTIEEAIEAYKCFEKPRHRIEFVGKRGDVSYYDDSKATNVAATIAGVLAIPGKVVLIAGGVHKGSSYLPWREAFSGKVLKIVTIGQAAEQIALEVGGAIEVEPAKTLQEAVEKASEFLKEPHAVLLSPGCSSFDMFADYKERGDRFKAIVESLGGLSK